MAVDFNQTDNRRQPHTCTSILPKHALGSSAEKIRPSKKDIALLHGWLLDTVHLHAIGYANV
jgi:hypothetical protein